MGAYSSSGSLLENIMQSAGLGVHSSAPLLLKEGRFPITLSLQKDGLEGVVASAHREDPRH